MQVKTRNKHILLQAAIIFAVLFGVFIVINSIATYVRFYDMSLNTIKTDSDETKRHARDMFLEYASLPWLLDYWQENYKTLDVSRDSIDLAKYAKLPKDLLLNSKRITPEQAESFSPELQNLFAEMCYREIAANLDELCKVQNLHSLYLVEILENKDAFVFYYKGIDEAVLGDIFPFDITKHSVIQEMYSTGRDPENFEIIQVKDYDVTHKTEELFYNYSLLEHRDNDLCHLTVSFLGTEIKEFTIREVMKLAGINILCFVSLGVILLLAINSLILKPLLKIQKDVKNYTDTKDTPVIVNGLEEIKSENEIGRLADNISTLAVELDHYTTETGRLSAEKARIDSELSLAAIIQEGVLPKDFPDMKEFKLFATLDPAKEVGGDLYDFFMIDDDHIALIIGDVSGKGISAALFMMKVKTILKETALSNRALSLNEIVTKANKLLCDGNEAMMFVTIWFGSMTISTGELVSINAGHEYPVIRSGGGLFEIKKTRHAGPLAVKSKAVFTEEKIILKPGDTFFIYTDGLAEANNENQEQFGLDRIVNSLNEKPDNDPEELTESMLQKMSAFVGGAPQFDDTTILCVKYFGK